MFEGLTSFFKKVVKNNPKLEESSTSKDAAKERLHLVLMQDRANVSADFLDLMKQEIIDVIKKYVDIDDKEIDVRLTNQANDDGTNGAPALYANIPIINIKNGVIGEKMRENSAQMTIEDLVKAQEDQDKEKEEKKEKEQEQEEKKEEVPEVIELGEPKEEEKENQEEKPEEIKEEVKEEKNDEEVEEENKEEEIESQEETTEEKEEVVDENNPENNVTHKKNRTKKTAKKK